MSRRTLFDRLVSAREALARARERGDDPWRLAELQTEHDRLHDAAREAAEAAPQLGLAVTETRARRGRGGR